MYVLSRQNIPKEYQKIIQSAFLTFEDKLLKKILKTDKIFVHSDSYPSSFFSDKSGRFLEAIKYAVKLKEMVLESKN
jgi:hypothetical protein